MMRSGYHFRALVLVLLGSGIIGYTFRRLQRPPVARGAGSLAFTVQELERRYAKGGTDPVQVSEVTYARRPDGSWSHTYSAVGEDGQSRQVLEYVDFARMNAAHLEPVTGSVTTFPLVDRDVPAEATAVFKGCDGSESIARARHSKILGYDVVEVSKTYGAETEVNWVAPALDCFSLQSTASMNGSHNEVTATSVRVGEPSAALFETPAGYVERSPKEVQALYSTRVSGGRLFTDKMLEQVESRYQKARARR